MRARRNGGLCWFLPLGLALLMVFSVLLPALPAAWMARQPVTRSL